MKEVVERLRGGLIVSCQAYEDSPLYGAENMARMARCAEVGGARGVRACWPQDIRAVRAATSLPIVGINKRFGDGDPLDDIFITPTFDAAAEVIEAGCDIVGIDCTIRPSRQVDELVALLRAVNERYPHVAIMADLATVDEAVTVAETGCVDIISTTLAGYTRQSQDRACAGPDVRTLREIKAAVDLPVNGEGRIWELADLDAVIQAGADMVTIGSAVTRPNLITERFARENKRLRSS
ncbi:N-acetylmannosamine-6-phosphate 2-epimerase [Enorma sp.]|uniref:N-acetylmannosamine-6-phosphate 2-epimerase n=1 Tax=Enorma sp. TaxID=1920692 RepID=UPI003AB115A5